MTMFVSGSSTSTGSFGQVETVGDLKVAIPSSGTSGFRVDTSVEGHTELKLNNRTIFVNDDIIAIGENVAPNDLAHQKGGGAGGRASVYIGNEAGENVDNSGGGSAQNTFIGNTSGQDVTSGIQNTFLGSNAGSSVTTGNGNVIIGQGSVGNADIDSNIIIGHSAGKKVGANGGNADHNIVLGNGTVSSKGGNIDHNILMGYRTSKELGDAHGSYNVHMGYEAASNVVTASYNVAIGYQALEDAGGASSGGNHVTKNIAIGYRPLVKIDENAQHNIAIGVEAANNNISGSNNIVMGYRAAYQNSGDLGSDNIFMGNSTGNAIDGGEYNVCLGKDAGLALTTANDNILIGQDAGAQQTTGNHIIALGKNAGKGSGVTANTNATSIFIGKQAYSGESGATNETVIGTDAIGKGSNTVVLGDDNVTDIYMSEDVGAKLHTGDVSGSSTSTGSFADGRFTGKVGLGVSSPAYKLHISSSDEKTIQFDRTGQETYRLTHGTSGLFFTKPNSVGVAYGVTQDGDFDTFDASGNRIIRSDASTGNVGIGLLSPQFKVHISGSTDLLWLQGSGAPQLRMTDNSATSDGDTFALIDFAGMDHAGSSAVFNRISNVIVDNTQGTTDSRLTIHNHVAGTLTEVLSVASGKVGIGKTNPSDKLEIADGAVNGATYMNLNNNHADQFLSLGINGNVGEIAVDNGDSLSFGTYTNKSTKTLNTIMTITNDGQISGSSTSTGSFGSLVVADAVQGNLHVEGGNVTIDSGNYLYFQDGNASIRRNSNDIQFHAYSGFIFSNNPGESFRIDNSGNFLIADGNNITFAGAGNVSGSAASTGSFGRIEAGASRFLTEYSLEVAEYISHFEDSDTYVRFQNNTLDLSAGGALFRVQNNIISGSSTSTGSFGAVTIGQAAVASRRKLTVAGGIEITQEGGDNFELVYNNGNNNFNFGNVGTGNLSNIFFYANNAAKMFISGSGNVGIGNTSPSKELTVAGEISASSHIVAGGNLTTGGQILSPGGSNIALNPNTGLVTIANNLQLSGYVQAAGNLLSTGANAKISGSSSSTGSFGMLGIGVASPNGSAQINNSVAGRNALNIYQNASGTAGVNIVNTSNANQGLYVYSNHSSAISPLSYVRGDHASGYASVALLAVENDNTSGMAISSKGKVLHETGDLEVRAGNISGSATSTGSFGNVYVGKGGAQFQNTKFSVVDNNSTEYAPMGGSSNTANAMVQFTNTNTSATAPHALIHFRLDKSGGDGYMGFMTSTSTGNIEHFVVGNQVDGELIRGASGGNVGIGDSNPSGKLVVSGSGTINLHIDNSGTGDTGLLGKRNATSIFGMFDDASDSKLRIVNYQAEPIEFSVDRGGTETIVMTMVNSGRVGIGNTSPESILDVSGSNSFGQLQIRDGNNSIYRRFFVSASGAHGLGTLHIQNRAFPGSGTSDVYTHFKNSVSGGTTRMNVIVDGKVGIGTTSPVGKLHVLGEFYNHLELESAAGNVGITFDVETSNTNYYDWRIDAQGTVANGLCIGHSTGLGNQTFNADNMVMTLKSGGNVGIADTSPAQPLVVSGSSKGLLSVGLVGGGSRVTIGDTTMDSALYMRRSSNGAANVQVLQLGSSLYVGATSNVINTVIQSNTSVLTVGSSKVTSNVTVEPTADASYNLGTADKRWANIFSADLQLSNEGTEGNEVDGTTGSWTIQEGEDDLYLLNRKNGKKYKFKLEEIT